MYAVILPLFLYFCIFANPASFRKTPTNCMKPKYDVLAMTVKFFVMEALHSFCRTTSHREIFRKNLERRWKVHFQPFFASAKVSATSSLNLHPVQMTQKDYTSTAMRTVIVIIDNNLRSNISRPRKYPKSACNDFQFTWRFKNTRTFQRKSLSDTGTGTPKKVVLNTLHVIKAPVLDFLP